jgi:hypothetical protein
MVLFDLATGKLGKQLIVFDSLLTSGVGFGRLAGGEKADTAGEAKTPGVEARAMLAWFSSGDVGG